MVSAVASRYAKALLEVVLQPGSGIAPEDVVSKLRSVGELIRESVDLRHVMGSPAVPPSRKRAVIAQLTEPLALPPHLRNFLFVVIDHRRLAYFSSILEGFEELLDDHLGFVRADIHSAFELTGAQRNSLETQLSRLTGKRARLRFSLDPDLLGGVVARVGSVVYDGSVRGQLENLRQKLAAAG